MANICVFCSSKNVDDIYQNVAIELGNLIGNRNHHLVYGGGRRGLMGLVAVSAKSTRARVKGVIPEIFSHVAEGEDEVEKAENMRHRKALMEHASDAFIALAGGFGTLDEIADIAIQKYIRVHTKPLVIINTNNFYDHLLAHFNKIVNDGFMDKTLEQNIYHVVSTPEQALDYIELALPAYKSLKTG